MPATRLYVTEWVDENLDAPGYPAESGYIELFWLPVLGPSATVLLWRLQNDFEFDPDGFSIELNELSQELGLGTVESKHAPIHRALARLVQFGLAKRMEPRRLVVRCEVAPLSPHQESLLSPWLQAAHQKFIRRVETAGGPDLPASEPWPREDQRAD
jgi:hypothetical protein